MIVQGIFRDCSWDPTPVEGKGREGRGGERKEGKGREGKKTKLGRGRSQAAMQFQWTSQLTFWEVLKMD